MRYDEYCLYNLEGHCMLKAFYSTVSIGKRSYREHYHAECEISTFVSGNGIYNVNGVEYPFTAGSVFLFNSNEPHCITDINSKFELLNIHFIPSMLFSNLDLSLMAIFFQRNKNFCNKIDPLNPATHELHKNIISIHDELKKRNHCYEAMVKSYIYSVFVSLNRDYNYVQPFDDYSSFIDSSKAIAKAIDFIDEHLTEKLTLTQIAEHANMSSTYFSSLFKKINGISPWEYITAKRVEKAIFLLKTTSMTKLDIASESGFSSSSNFYKAFNKITARCPDDYQNL